MDKTKNYAQDRLEKEWYQKGYKQALDDMETRAWVHIDEIDDSKDHSREFGRGWNANAEDLVDWIEKKRKTLK